MSDTISTDIYKITDFVNNIKKKFVENQSEDTLLMSTFGYLGSTQSSMLQNSIIVASELANEAFPTKAKFERNVLTHAISYNINDINAIPAKMQVLLGFLESELLALMIGNVFTVDKNCKLYIGDYEFHLDYNLEVIKSDISSNESIYTARYNIDRTNELSDISTPYISPPPSKIVMQNASYIFVTCLIRQVEITKQAKKIITTNIIDNKTIDFEFESQLATFRVIAKDNNIETILTPIFEGGIIPSNVTKYCYYDYVAANAIRLKFVSQSYSPTINTEIEIQIITTQGVSGNFTYKDDIYITLESEKYSYNNMGILLKPITDSVDGQDRKSVAKLKQLLPKEALARGSITSETDLNNYFDSITDVSINKILFKKKVDNQLSKIFYSYIILKDDIGVIPTNTIDIELYEDDFSSLENGKYILNPGNYISYDGTIGKVLHNPTSDDLSKVNFLYTTPFLNILNYSALYGSSYLNILKETKLLQFNYINQKCDLQFIGTTSNWKREFLTDRNIYKLNMTFSQNINVDKELIVVEKDGTISTNKTKIIAVLYNSTTPYRYMVGDLISYDSKNLEYSYEFKFETNDIMDNNNYIRIENTYIPKSTSKDYGYLNDNISVNIYILAEFDSEYGREDLDDIIPELDGYTLCNIYTIKDGLNFFYNYSNIMSLKVVSEYVNDSNGNTVEKFIMKNVPVLKYNYINLEKKIDGFIDQLKNRKEYLDNALTVMEDPFGIDFKLFNTYGPSKTYTVGVNNTILDRINITLNFRIKLVMSSDKYTKDYIIKDIKSIIENLNDISDLHIPNLIADLTNTYKTIKNSIVYIEFLGINGYGPGVQHIYKKNVNNNIVPEFINVSMKSDESTPDINIELA